MRKGLDQKGRGVKKERLPDYKLAPTEPQSLQTANTGLWVQEKRKLQRMTVKLMPRGTSFRGLDSQIRAVMGEGGAWRLFFRGRGVF